MLARFFPKTKKRSAALHRPSLVIEPLEARRLMIAEGAPFSLDQAVETAGLLGTISAKARWGDGTTSDLSVSSAPAVGPLKVRFDYSLDSANFFDTATKRQALQYAADILVSKFGDSLSAIAPSGTNRWEIIVLDPTTGQQRQISNPTIAANEILVYVGSRDLPGNQLAEGGAGGSSSSGTQEWVNLVSSRGQAGALQNPQTDFGPWGGQIVFDRFVPWYFGLDSAGIASGQQDFLSVATHELAHLLGFGVAPSWKRFVSGSSFTGPMSQSAYDAGGAVPVASDLSHWREGLTDAGQETLMDPSISAGTRKLTTNLDLAAMGDLGWQVITQTARVSGTHTFGDNASFPVSIDLVGSQLGSRTVSATAAITNVAPTLATQANRNVSAAVPFSITDLGSFTDPGFDLPNAIPPSTERFSYRIDWGDGTPVDTGSATIDRAGAVGVLTLGSFNGTHTYATPGAYTVRYSVTDDDGGSAAQSFVITAGGAPTLSLAIDKGTIKENAGNNAATLTVRRSGFDLGSATTVVLGSSDASELTLPATVILAAGVSEITVGVNAIDDTILDGLQVVQITASSGSISAPPLNVNVEDVETLSLTLSQSSVRENDGPIAAHLTITRSNTDRGQALAVALSSSDTTEANLPTNAVIPAGAASVEIEVQAIDDTLIDGTQRVVLTGSSSGYVAGTANLDVNDYEPIQLAIAPNQLTEAIAGRRGQATLNLPAAAPSGGLVITLSEPTNQLTIPAQVIVPAGQSSVKFSVEAKDNFRVEGDRTVQVTASNPALVAAAVDVVIADDDLPLWKNPTRPFDVNEDNHITPLDALLIINRLNLRGSGELVPGVDDPTPLVDPNGNGLIEPLDALLIINYLNLNGAS